MTFKVGDRVRYIGDGRRGEVVGAVGSSLAGALVRVRFYDDPTAYEYTFPVRDLGREEEVHRCPTCNGAGWVRDGGGDDTE